MLPEDQIDLIIKKALIQEPSSSFNENLFKAINKHKEQKAKSNTIIIHVIFLALVLVWVMCLPYLLNIDISLNIKVVEFSLPVYYLFYISIFIMALAFAIYLELNKKEATQ